MGFLHEEAQLLSNNKTKITYPCGYVEEKDTTVAVYGLRYNGQRPCLIEIFGDFSFNTYRHFERAVDPVIGSVLVHE